MSRFISALAAFFFIAFAAVAAEPEYTPEQKAEIDRLVAIEKSLKPQHGTIILSTANARLNLGDGYYFLAPDDARKVLVEAWGNPPDAADGVLGLIFPEGRSIYDAWGAAVTYEQTFYVSDEDARTADYDQLMKEMQSGEGPENEARKKAGYAPIRLIGWAQPPAYDAGRNDLIWAREMQFGDEAEHTLNYDVRHLGRQGVLSLNMISTMSEIDDVRAAALALSRTAEFDAGSRYADYRDGDKTSGYGLAGLVAAGAGLAVAKKAGMIAIILAFAKKGFVFIVAAGAGLYGWLRRRFNKSSKTLDLGTPSQTKSTEDTAVPPPPS